MTKAHQPLVRFYVLAQGADDNQRLRLVCQLVEKAQQAHKQVAILCADQSSADKLDALLWSYKADSFLPHCFADDPLRQQASAVLYIVPERLAKAAVIINLSLEQQVDIPRGCERIFEIVTQEPMTLNATRARYNGYRQIGLTAQTYKF